MEKSNKKKDIAALLAVIGGNVIFGFSFLFSKIALDITEPGILIAIRFLVAFLVLNLTVLLGKLFTKGEFAFSLKGKPKKQVLLLALCQPVIYFIAESYGIKYTSSSFAGLMIAMIPIAGLVADALIMHSKISTKQVLCAILSVAGVIITTIGAESMKSSALGIVMLAIAVVSGAMFYVFSKNAAAYYNPLERTYVMFGVGSVAFTVIALVQNKGNVKAFADALSEPMFLLSIGYLAVISSVVAFLLLNFGSNHISVSKATLMANSTTVISILAGVLILNEPFTLMQIIGAVVIIVSVTAALLQKPGEK